MQGIRVHVATPDDLTDIRFKLYDNEEAVIENINTVDFDYLIQEPYTGVHKLELTYYETWNPTNESHRIEILNRNFTLKTLALEITYEIF